MAEFPTKSVGEVVTAADWNQIEEYVEDSVQPVQLLSSSTLVAVETSLTNVVDTSVALPAGWGSMDFVLNGYISYRIGSTSSSDRSRVEQRVESPSGTQVGPLAATLVFRPAGIVAYSTLPITARLLGATGSTTVRVRSQVTSGASGSGELDAEFRYVIAQRVRRS